MPSLGNQYFAFGGSLPDISLTSLTRLLPNSSANDPGMSSCPGLFTLPLYVYPSQQHLATPFINTHGSISFGSFLSSGSSLCSTSKAGPIGVSSGSPSPGERLQSNASSSGASATSDEKESRCGQASGSTPLLSESVIKLPMYSPMVLGNSSSGSGASVITSFGTLARGMEPGSMDVSGSTSTRSSLPLITASNQAARSPASVTNHNTLGSCIIGSDSILQLHPQAASSSDHTHHHLPIHHASPPSSSSSSTLRGQDMSPRQPRELYLGVAGDNNNNTTSTTGLQTVPTIMGRIKMERDLDPLDSLSPSSHGALPIMSPEAGLHIHSPPQEGMVAAAAGAGGKAVVKREKEKPYKCDHPGCGRSFSFPAHLRSHIQQIHISYRPCKCEFPGCGKRFYTPQHLNVHRRVHTGERPFICPYAECSKAFTTAGNLKNHIRTHTGERPYACKFEGCNKRFAEMSSLKKHELTHTGEKPYKCRVCGKAFSQAGSRNTHERKHSRASGAADGEAGAVVGEEGEVGSRGIAGEGRTKGGVGGLKKYKIKRVSSKGPTDEPMQH